MGQSRLHTHEEVSERSRGLLEAHSQEVAELRFTFQVPVMKTLSVASLLGPSSRLFPQAYGIGGLRKRQDTASLEDRDKPYVCDSESF